MEKTKLPNKGYAIKEYGDKITTSYLMSEWLKTSQALSGANDNVKREWMQFRDNGRYLLEGAMMRMTQDMTQLWVKGLDPISAVN